MSKQVSAEDAARAEHAMLRLHQVIEVGLKPNADAIGEVLESGAVPILIFEPTGGAVEVAQTFGWHPGSGLVVPMPDWMVAMLGASDVRVAAWLNSSIMRVFIITGDGWLMLSADGGRFYVAPCSDPELALRAVGLRRETVAN